MATLLSRSSGNLKTATTFGLVDNTSFNNSETGTSVVTTSFLYSAEFIPGAITLSGLGVKLAARTGVTGTISINLSISGVEVPGTNVTINVSDLPSCTTPDRTGGWVFFKFGSPITLLAATTYTVGIKSSSSSQVTLYTNGTSANWTRALVTTTNQAPTTGDDIIICGEFISPGVFNAITVTMDETSSSIDYGSGSNNLATPAVCICANGTLSYGVSTSTNYYFRVSGHIIVYNGGVLSIGTVSIPIPRDSTATLAFDPTVGVDFGLTIRNLGTFNSQGLSRTSGKDIYYCYLNTDEPVNSTSLGVDTDTGWLDNDVIVVGSTTRTYTQSEKGALNGNAGTSILTVDSFAGVSGGLAAAHSGSSPTRAEVVLLTRNVLVTAFGAFSTYIDIKSTATINCSWTGFTKMGSNTANKRGIETTIIPGVTQSFTFCSFYDMTSIGSTSMLINTATAATLVYTNNVSYNIASSHFYVASGTCAAQVTNNFFIRNGSSSVGLIHLLSASINFSNNIITSAFSNGSCVYLADTSGTIGTFSNNIIHSSGGSGLAVQSIAQGGVISNITIWRCNATTSLGGGGPSSGLTFLANANGKIHDLILNNITIFGCDTSSVGFGSSCGRIEFNDCQFSGDTSFSTLYTINFNLVNAYITSYLEFNNTVFGLSSGIFVPSVNSDFWVVANCFAVIVLRNCLVTAPTFVSTQTNLTKTALIVSQKHNQQSQKHRTLKRTGTILSDDSIYYDSGISLKLSPISSLEPLESSGLYGGFRVPVENGTSVAPSVYVYKDAAYNGSQPKLVVKKNPLLGISSDTVLDTATSASDLNWEQLTGATISVSEFGVLEFVVSCDGTLGSVYVDSFSCV